MVRVTSELAFHYLFLVWKLVNIFGNFETKYIGVINAITRPWNNSFFKILENFFSFLLNEQLFLQVIADFVNKYLVDEHLKLHNGVYQNAQPKKIIHVF